MTVGSIIFNNWWPAPSPFPMAPQWQLLIGAKHYKLFFEGELPAHVREAIAKAVGCDSKAGK